MVYRMKAPDPIRVRQQKDYNQDTARSLGRNIQQMGQAIGQNRINKAYAQYMGSGGIDPNAKQVLDAAGVTPKADLALDEIEKEKIKQGMARQAKVNNMAIFAANTYDQTTGTEAERIEQTREILYNNVLDAEPRDIPEEQRQANAMRLAGMLDMGDIQGGRALRAKEEGTSKFSAKTMMFNDGTTVQTTTTGGKVVTDASGTILTGDAAAKAIKAGIDSGIAEQAGRAGAREGAVLEERIAAAREQAFEDVMGKEGAKIYSSLQQSAQSASAFMPKLERLKEMAEGGNTGAWAKARMAGKWIGLDVSDAETLNAGLMGMAQEILNQQTGTKTDFDFQVAVEQSASLGKSPEANIALINALIARQEQAIHFGDMAKQALKEGGPQGVLDLRYSAPKASEAQEKAGDLTNKSTEELLNGL